MIKPMLLIVDDEKPTREGLRAVLEDRYDVYLAEDTAAAVELLEKEHFDVLLTDFRLPSEDGMKLITRARSLSKPPVCILMTAYGSEELAVEAMKLGADDYIAKGRLQIDELEMRIARRLRQQGLAPTLLESELFGHEKGAFTGAHERRIGWIEQAQGGTLFLDEIGEIDASIQIKLLRFLGERTFARVGSNKTLTADVRLIAATNKSLEDLVKAGTFREDLYFRLKVVEVRLPALRERAADIPLLAQSFLREFAE